MLFQKNNPIFLINPIYLWHIPQIYSFFSRYVCDSESLICHINLLIVIHEAIPVGFARNVFGIGFLEICGVGIFGDVCGRPHDSEHIRGVHSISIKTELTVPTGTERRILGIVVSPVKTMRLLALLQKTSDDFIKRFIVELLV